jgi:hypothetical protein
MAKPWKKTSLAVKGECSESRNPRKMTRGSSAKGTTEESDQRNIVIIFLSNQGLNKEEAYQGYLAMSLSIIKNIN